MIIIVLMMEAARTSETSVDNYFTRQYIPEDKSEQNDYNSVKIIDREIQIVNFLKLSGNYMCHLLYLFKA
jgi:hypothetical protein